MPVHDELGKRMKSYEKQNVKSLTPKTPVIIRIDGKAFHTFTKKLYKPFDDLLISAMKDTMVYLCQNIAGCVLGYMQSDEISLLLQDYKNENTQPWFDYRLDKLCSISASMATFAFNKSFKTYTDEYYLYGSESQSSYDEYISRINALMDCCEKGALFDARAFSLPFEEVTNYFYWREVDAIRNSIQMVGHSIFSDKELHKVNTKGIKEKLLSKGIDFDKLPLYKQRGICCIKKKTPSLIPNEQEVMRTVWVSDMSIPVFKDDGRNYIESKLGDDYY